MRMLLNLLIMLAVAYLAVVLLVYLGQPRLVYFPEKQLSNTPGAIGLDYSSVNIATSDGETLHSWWMPVPDAKGTVLFFHGNAGNISHRINYLAMFKRLGYNTLLFDYRGYGQSSGVPSESGTYLDAQAAWRYLTEAKGIAPAQIVLYGESLGGAVAAWLRVENLDCWCWLPHSLQFQTWPQSYTHSCRYAGSAVLITIHSNPCNR